ncbi:hypothetical protein, partial [Streptococcus pneumoniae]|uniref:hypothetical protein n=1 Tax=Streptococcus pneumoniae TaxID=1313 RepID=UPI001C5AF319
SFYTTTFHFPREKMYSDGGKFGSSEGEGGIPPPSPLLLQSLSQKIFFRFTLLKNFLIIFLWSLFMFSLK